MTNARKRLPKKAHEMDRIIEPGGDSDDNGPDQLRANADVGQKPSTAPWAGDFYDFELINNIDVGVKYKDEFDKIMELLRVNRYVVSENELRFELGNIVFLFGGWYQDEDYFRSIEQCLRNAVAAKSLLDSMSTGLKKLDSGHFVLLTKMIDAVLMDVAGPSGPSPLARVEEASSVINLVCVFLTEMLGPRLGTYIGRPLLPYDTPTFKLMLAWTKVTGKPVPYPKGRTNGNNNEEEFSQPSTEFIRLGLKMLDLDISLSNIESIIKRMLITGKEIEEFRGAAVSGYLNRFRMLEDAVQEMLRTKKFQKMLRAKKRSKK